MARQTQRVPSLTTSVHKTPEITPIHFNSNQGYGGGTLAGMGR